MNSLSKRLEPKSYESSQMPFMGLFVFAAVLLGIIVYAIPFFLHTFVLLQIDSPQQINVTNVSLLLKEVF